MNPNHCLIFNESKIQSMYRVRRVLHRPVPYAKNPLVFGSEYCDREKLAELQTGKANLSGQAEGPETDQHKLIRSKQEFGFDKWFLPSQFGARAQEPVSIVKSPLTGRLQMYYWVNGGLAFADSGWGGGSSVTCYAESEDGINWHLPVLRKVSVFGSTENNVLFGPGSYPYVVLDTNEKDPAKIYKAFIHPGPRIAFSADGINWSEPLKASLNTKIGRSDGDTFFGWDEYHKKYVAYFRPWREFENDPADKHFRRRIGRAQSDDLINWNNHLCVLSADNKDPEESELERMVVFRYGDLYLGLLVVFNTVPEQRHAISHMHGTVYVELAYSSDGIKWHRFDERDPFLSFLSGIKDAGMALPAHQCVEIEDQLYFYYESTNLLHGEFPYNARCCLARLTKDRFAGFRADDLEGYVQTKPFVCPGGKLRVNADVSVGHLRAAVVASDGIHELEYAMYRCNYIQSQATEHTIKWMNATDLNALKGKSISLKFYLRNAEIFSYWFE